MDYEEFLEYIRENIVECLENMEQAERYIDEAADKDRKSVDGTADSKIRYEVELHKVMKNNGIVLDGLLIRRKEERICPNIYLNDYYESYRMGKPISAIMEEIILRYCKLKEDECMELDDIMDYSLVKDKIILRLVNHERNREMLENCPHKRYLDLAVTFRHMVSRDDSRGIASRQISNEEYENWGIGLDELYETALENTMREFPWQIQSLTEVLLEALRAKGAEILADKVMSEMEGLQEKGAVVVMYVLGNDVGINGATSILYNNVLQHFAKVQGANLFVLPSSVHEMILVPEEEDTDPQFLQELVNDANKKAVGLVELLSDNIYYYDRDKNEISIYDKTAKE